MLHRFRTLRIGAATALVLAIAPIASPSVQATEAGPNGANIGFDFTWDDIANPAGHSASFLETDGTTANNCSGTALTSATKTCNFVFDYRINGVLQKTTSHAARWIKWANVTSYAGGKPTGATGCSSGTSGSGNFGKAPLTLFDCFNASSFGQVFYASTTGPLTQFRMSMTCLAPSGVPRYEMYALLYELSADGGSLLGSPAAATLVNLSNCPTATTWNGKTFTSANFAMTAMSFNNAPVTAGKFYGVYLTGTGVPGTPPPGSAAAIAAARAASTTTTTTTTTTPWSSFKNQTKGNTKTPTTNTVATATPAPVAGPAAAPFAVTALGASRFAMSAVRLMTEPQSKKYIINSLTPKVCLGSAVNLAFLKTGRCTAQVLRRSNGKIATTVTTRVVAGVPEVSEEVVVLAAPTVAYFNGGTALVKAKSKKDIAALTATARTASSILVTGHSGNIGGERANMVKLSQQRASAVRSLLRGKGVSRTIAIWSFGATFPVTNSKSNAEQDLNRRAEIYLIP
jgi:outer membrane protein OmpA-like peptidoglycan-associated protein